MKNEFLYRRNTVREALRGRRRPLFRLWLEQRLDKRVAQEFTAAATAIRLPIETADKDKLGKLAQDRGHQGVVLECGPYQYAEVDEMLGRARQMGDKPFLLLLDQVQGPQNMGILLRTAEACGVHGIIMQDRNAPDINIYPRGDKRNLRPEGAAGQLLARFQVGAVVQGGGDDGAAEGRPASGGRQQQRHRHP